MAIELRVRPVCGLGLGLETCGLATYRLGLDDFKISGVGERGLGLATRGLDYISAIVYRKTYELL